MSDKPILIAVAPNGARKTREDHPAIPLSAVELAQTAQQCQAAGAGMIHVHIRDDKGLHSLDVETYRETIRKIEAELGDSLLIQVTSEAAGRYKVDEQVDAMKTLTPHCMSCGLREFIPDENNIKQGSRFFNEMFHDGTLIQYILYSPSDVQWFEQLFNDGAIPGNNPLVLLVLGHRKHNSSQTFNLSDYLAELNPIRHWMVCAFGKSDHVILQEAISLGGHIRIGFENNLLLPDGSLAPDNATLVRYISETVTSTGRMIADRTFAEALFR